jgi:uncharacterized protein (DUF2141 family)
MVTKRVLTINVLATFCLAATLFMIVPTRSQSDKYDPWTDINGDGSIDMADISMGIDGFMSSGDATKPVVVGGYNWSADIHVIAVAPGEEGNISVATAGYKQMTLGFEAHPFMQPPPYENVSVATGFLMGNSQRHVYVDRFNVTAGWTGPEPPVLQEYPVVRTYAITGQSLTIAYYNPTQSTYMLTIEFYITT